MFHGPPVSMAIKYKVMSKAGLFVAFVHCRLYCGCACILCCFSNMRLGVGVGNHDVLREVYLMLKG